MGLKTAIQSATKAGVVALGDLKKPCIYIQVKPGAYDATVGAESDITNKITLANDITLVRFKKSEVDDEEVLKTDWKGLVLQSDLHFRPNKGDRLEIERRIYRVVEFSEDPASALWIIQIREGL